MMAEHTKEPWSVDTLRRSATLLATDLYIVTSAADDVGRADSEANARRIVACVNACAGIPTERLEQSGVLAELLDAAHSWQRTPNSSPTAADVDQRLCHAIDAITKASA